ncbi:hypothetical protein L211DRAFT_818000 [Terfezia boudieri ATCC MYA-4762]|uniref:CENP-V/GFA domain-containing protein n=1 Tax=Terfezia boudieri ATCC MYA-4762 TaxID=1051890 RepID=A0A3N4LZN1_9PEZI|nr:hypothetical protein L211DRAFT_818000 [Terfezia boudieri ATCC MYA-4762]
MAEPHKPITGGCLCECVRYTIHFPPDAKSPQVSTCQCTQCRKNTGSLIIHFITVPSSCITWARPKPGPQHEAGSSVPTTTFQEYMSSPGCFRGFCEMCGTTLTWRSKRTGDKVDIMLGTVDEECLTKELCLPVDGQHWCKNFIKGVTDIIPEGDRWFEDSGEDGVKLN